MNRRSYFRFREAFTLIELCAVVVVIGILAGVSFPVYFQFRSKAEAVSCAANMRVLYGGAAAYVQEHQAWPKIPKVQKKSDGGIQAGASQEIANKWIAALKPYGVGEYTWRCPSVERDMRKHGKPDALKIPRLDYTPTLFEGGALAPYQWTTHPWFIERGSPHGKGPLIILADGRVVTVEDLMRLTGK